MATAGQVIENPHTGERIEFVEVAADNGGARLVLETLWTRPGQRAAEHIHPAMTERFDVLEGRAAFLIDGERSELGPGESVTVPPGTRHLPWNPTEDPVRLRLTFTPALRWELFIEQLFANPADAHAIATLLREFAAEITLP